MNINIFFIMQCLTDKMIKKNLSPNFFVFMKSLIFYCLLMKEKYFQNFFK